MLNYSVRSSFPNLRGFATMFIMAMTLLMQQILYTRLFSVTLLYHYAYLVIALTLLGLTLGALAVHYAKARIERSNSGAIVGYLSALSSLFSLAALYIQLHFQMPAGLSAIFYNSLLLMPTFTLGGAAITILLMRDTRLTNRMYAVDLCGAAFGCLMALILLNMVGVLSSLLLTTFFLALAALISFPAGRIKIIAACLTLCVAGYSAANIHYSRLGAPLLKLTQVPLEFEAWNSYSQIIIPASRRSPHQIIIDRKASTPIYQWGGDMRDLEGFKDDLFNVAYHMRDIKKMLVIGVGGGMDILSALAFGASDITGLEMNKTTYDIVTKHYAQYSGNIQQRPGVTLINKEARSFLEQSKEHYDLIQISMIDTWAATAAGAFAMTENGLYTVEAWRTFLRKLSPNGTLSVMRWYGADTHPGELYRMLTVAREAMLQEGITQPRQHIAVVAAEGRATLLISKSPITPQEIEKLKTNAAKPLILSPEYSASPDMETLLASPDIDGISDRLKMDLTPSTDNKPFFFNMVSLKQIWQEDMNSIVHNINAFNLAAVHYQVIIFLVIFVCVACILLLTIRSAFKANPAAPRHDIACNILYFSMIGFGFLLVELSLLQQLTLFLGHPSYALSVVLSILLLSSGIGSFIKQHIDSARLEMMCLIALFVVLLAQATMNGALLNHTRGFEDPLRIAIAIGLLLSCGILMGMAMPLGIKYIRMSNTENLAPWLWGINGATSVLASVGGICISIFFGVQATFLCGAACYGVVALLYGSRALRKVAL